ncbi:MAG: hypothetical protein KatS3mg009_0352 [Acidimicrobiia bacterium]|nr:MAG: hypothetical protein KatS3mg009_0352 [Acidimicrobiia bacterium]
MDEVPATGPEHEARLEAIMRAGRARRRARRVRNVTVPALALLALVGVIDLAGPEPAPAPPVAARPPVPTTLPADPDPPEAPAGATPPGTWSVEVGSSADPGAGAVPAQLAGELDAGQAVVAGRGEPTRSPSCTVAVSCAWIELSLGDVTGATATAYRCIAEPGGTFHSASVAPGTRFVARACAFGTPGARVRVEVDLEYPAAGGSAIKTVRSGEIVW